MSDLTVPNDRGIAHTIQSVISSLRGDSELTDLIGGSELIYPAKRAKKRDDAIAITVERVNTSSTWNGAFYRTFHVVQVKLVMTRPEMDARDPLYPDVVCDRINQIMDTAFPAGGVPRGRDDAGGMVINNNDTARRVQWPQRFRVLAFTAD